MKLSKTDFKNLVKECLVELLAEGLNSGGQVMIESRSKNKATPTPNPRLSRTPNAKYQFESKPQVIPNPKLDAQVETVKQLAGGNNDLALMLADTLNQSHPLLEENNSYPTSLASDEYLKAEPDLSEPQHAIWSTLAFGKE